MEKPALYIYQIDNPDIRIRIWPPGERKLPEGTVQENRTYVFELENWTEPDRSELFIDNVRLEPLRTVNGKARWRWQPGFYAGGVSMQLIYSPGHTNIFDFETDPDLRKLSRDDFNRMVSEILEDTLALLSLSSFHICVSKGIGNRPPPVARLEFLRSRIEEIDDVVNQIDRRPVRVLRSQTCWYPTRKITDFIGEDLVRSLAHSPLRAVQNPKIKERLPEALNGFLPLDIRKQIKSTGLRIREHEEIKAALRFWADLMDRYALLLSNWKGNEDREPVTIHWINRCRSLSSRLRNLLDLSIFSDIPDRSTRPVLSAIYRNIPSYRKFFQLYQDMNLGIANVFGDFLNVPLARTFDLYELWCFLRLLRVISRNYRKISVDNLYRYYETGTWSLTIPSSNITVPIGKNCEISFQRTYTEFWKDPLYKGSFSRPMVPDISFDFRDRAVSVLILDAKYRIDNQLSDAISSIHVYRDAIVHAEGVNGHSVERVVKGAFILSPFIPEEENDLTWQQKRIPGRFFHREYRGNFKFGAVTFKPGMTLEEIGNILEDLLMQANFEIATE